MSPKNVTSSCYDITEKKFTWHLKTIVSLYKSVPSYYNDVVFIQVHSDFVGAATRGAMAVIDGNVMAINPGEDAK